MSPRLLAILIIFPIWLALVLIFRRHRQWLLYYLVAAFGLTIQLVLMLEYLGYDQILVNVASFHVNLLSKYLFHLPIELLTNGRFQIMTPDGSSSILKLGIECSAVLESSIILSLIIFYPLFNAGQKFLRVLFGLIVTYTINILRLMIIVLMAYKFGSDYIFIAHAGVARIFFFICELILYWYLMTKPSVKAVGLSIEGKIPVEKAATIGRAFKLRYAITQSSVIFIFAILVGISFISSNEWQKTLSSTAQKERPIVYQDETAMEAPTSNEGRVLGAEDNQPNLQNEQISGEFCFENSGEDDNQPIFQNEQISGNFSFDNMLSLEQRSYSYQVLDQSEFSLRLVQGTKPVQIEIYKNGQLEDTACVQVPEYGLILDQNVFGSLISAKAGDILEIKFKNTGESKADYVAEIISEGTNDSQVSSASTEASITPDQNQVDTTVSATASAETETSTPTLTPAPTPTDSPTVTPTKTSTPVAQPTVAAEGIENTQITSPELAPSPPTLQPQPISPSLTQVPTFKDKVIKSIAILSSGLNNEEIATALSVGQKTTAVLTQKFKLLEQKIAEQVLSFLIGRQEQPIVYPDETVTPPPAAPDFQTPVAQPTIAGLATSSLDQEITLNLAGGEKSLQSFNIQQEEQLNIQVLEGQGGLAARLMLNGQSVELVTVPSWQFNKQTSIFQPLTVRQGDVLEIRFQNLAATPSAYLIKIFPNEGQK